MRPSKCYRFVLLGASVCVAAYLGFTLYQRHAPEPRDVEEKAERQPLPGPSFRMEGFHYTGTHRGEKSIAIRADEFTVEKKKLGFFRFSLMNTARLKNAEIDIYGVRADNPEGTARGTSGPADGQSTPRAGDSRIETIRSVLQRQALTSFSAKQFSSIIVEPISLRMHSDHALITQITAGSATISLRGTHVILRNGVRAVSGTSVLKAERATLTLNHPILITAERFLLVAPGEKLEGHRLQTDVGLNAVNIPTRSAHKHPLDPTPPR